MLVFECHSYVEELVFFFFNDILVVHSSKEHTN
jgi:hypothetical protein